MKPRKLKKREFARALRHGHGSAFLHVKEYGDESIANHLLNACLRNLIFDRQFENGRASWLARMVDATGRAEYYAEEVATALRSCKFEEYSDLQQLLELAVEFFERGFSEFKTILLDPSLAANYKELALLPYGRAIADLAGLSGFESACQFMAGAEVDEYEKFCMYEHGRKFFDEQAELDSFLDECAAMDELIAKFWQEVKAERSRSKLIKQAPAERKIATLGELIGEFENDEGTRRLEFKFSRFGKTASKTDLENVLKLIERETNNRRILCYLSVFRFVAPPAVSSSFLNLMFSNDRKIRYAASSALRNLQGPAVRKAALKALKSERQEFVSAGFKVFLKNYKSCDVDVLNSAFVRLKDPDHIHWVVMDIKAIAAESSDFALAPLLHHCFYSTPCSYCRKVVLELLLEWQLTPAQMLYEGQWDSEIEIRNIARAQIGKAEPCMGM